MLDPVPLNFYGVLKSSSLLGVHLGGMKLLPPSRVDLKLRDCDKGFDCLSVVNLPVLLKAKSF